MPFKTSPFAVQNESFCQVKRVLLKGKTSPFDLPAQNRPIPNASRTHPEGKEVPSRENNCSLPREKMFPPEKTKNSPLILYLIIYERAKNVAHLKKDA